ncbi:uncharacterized protein LOC123323041 [Coccinella septempunctata]|uniref:uncharacterized protein LOC123323041 n=1 Tax=Coccinella septempunctata TaxID=41139 RepID=UPI001D05C91C|nr:uncharacterized protein LOC123323041 [Coccinella septempunctata]
MLVRDSLSPRLVVNNTHVVEHLFVCINWCSKSYILGGTYIPPNSPDTIYESHARAVEELYYEHPDALFLLCGDYNLPGGRWADERFVLCEPGNVGECFSECCDFMELSQMNRLPNSRGIFLDLIFSSDNKVLVDYAGDTLLENSVHHFGYSIVIPRSDHFCVSDLTDSDSLTYDFKNCNYTELNNYFHSVDWSFCSSFDIDRAVAYFYHVVYNGIEMFVPKRVRGRGTFPHWFSKELKILIKRKKKAHARFKASNLPDDYEVFRDLRNQCKIESRKCFDTYCLFLESRIRSDPKFFWKHISRLKGTTNLPDKMSFSGVESSNSGEICELFAQFFGEVFIHEEIVPPPVDIPETVDFNTLSFSLAEVFDGISGLKCTYSCGPDSIPSFLLKQCIFSLSAPLCDLFNNSLKEFVYHLLYLSSSIS